MKHRYLAPAEVLLAFALFSCAQNEPYEKIVEIKQSAPLAYTIKIDGAEGGRVTRDPEADGYNAGDEVRITARADEGYTFAGWNGTLTGAEEELFIKVESNYRLIPKFTPIAKYSLLTEWNPVGGSVLSSRGAEVTFLRGEKCTLEAVPAPGYRFDGWQGDITGNDKTVYLTFDKDIQAYARFSMIPAAVTYTLTTVGTNGSVLRSPDKPVYFENETVRLTAVPSDTFMFTDWDGTWAGSGQSFDIVMTGNLSVGAEFTRRKWTVVLYMAADNDLESAAMQDLNELEAASPGGAPVSVLALVDRGPGYDMTNGDWTDTRLYEIEEDRAGLNTNLVSRRIPCARLGITETGTTELNLAEPAVLSFLLSSVRESHPAEDYCLIIWGHGTGWRSSGTAPFPTGIKAVAADDTSGDFMTVSEAGNALRDKGFSLIGMDTCFGSLLEIAYEFRASARYLVGSENATPASGWNYTGLIDAFCPTDLSVLSLAHTMAGQFREQYSTLPRATVSVIDLERTERLRLDFETFARSAADRITGSDTQGELRALLLQDCELARFNTYPCDVYIDIDSLREKIAARFPTPEILNSSAALASALSAALPLCWSAETDGKPKIGVHLIPFVAPNTPRLSHESGYIRGSGALDQSEFVRTSWGWVPNAVPSGSLLDKAFYTTF